MRKSGFKNGISKDTLFNSPSAVAARPNGVIVVCDRLNCCLRAIKTDGKTVLLAGVPSGQKGRAVIAPRDGPVSTKRFQPFRNTKHSLTQL
jgi:hypothetical protein